MNMMGRLLPIFILKAHPETTGYLKRVLFKLNYPVLLNVLAEILTRNVL